MTLPNALTLTRALLVVPVIGLIGIGDPVGALLIFLAAAATDAVDGPLARRHGATPLGAALDPLADKILVVGTLAALVLRGLAPAWAVALIVVREIVAIEIRARSPYAVIASADGKAKTVLQVLAAAALLATATWPSSTLAGTAHALLAAATALTVLSGVRLVLRAKQTTPDPA